MDAAPFFGFLAIQAVVYCNHSDHHGWGYWTMITFPETLNALEIVLDLLKSAAEVETAVNDANDDMDGLRSMMEFAHDKNFRDAKAALKYIDDVLIPQLNGSRQSLETVTEEPLKRLKMAQAQIERLVLRLRILDDGSIGNFLL